MGDIFTNFVLMIKCGIYTITNIITRQTYIGSAIDIHSRWRNHKGLLKRGKHHSLHLQNSWNKYGFNNFTFDIIEECSKDLLMEREQYYLDNLLKANDYFKSGDDFFIKYGFNVKPFAGRSVGFKQSQETINKMLATKNSSVYAVDINGIILNKFSGIGQAGLFYNIGYHVVIKSCYKKQTSKKLKNIGFIHERNYTVGYKPQLFIPHNKGIRSTKPATNIVQIYVYDLYGNLIEIVDSVKNCYKKYNIVSGFYKRLNREPIKYMGNHCKYWFTTKPVINETRYKIYVDSILQVISNVPAEYAIYDIYDKLIGYCNSQTEMCKLFNCSIQVINAWIKGKRKQNKGFIVKIMI
mgnify:CR=1 FL=1